MNERLGIDPVFGRRVDILPAMKPHEMTPTDKFNEQRRHVHNAIAEAISEAKAYREMGCPPEHGRAISLVITHLETAHLWTIPLRQDGEDMLNSPR